MPGTRQLLLFPRARARVPCRVGRKKKGASSTHSKVELGSPAKAGWKHMVWAPSLRGASYFALSNPSCPHSPPGCPADSWKTPSCLQGSVNPAGGIPERAPTPRPRPPSHWNAARAQARLPEQSARSRAPRIPVLIRVSANLSQWWMFTALEGGAKPSLTWGLCSQWALPGNTNQSAEKRGRGRMSSVWARIDGFEMEQLSPRRSD